VENALRSGRDIPPRIAGAPELEAGAEIWMLAFRQLTTERQIGWGVGPIPWSAIAAWAEEWELDEEQASDLAYYVRRMDREYIRLKTPKEDD